MASSTDPHIQDPGAADRSSNGQHSTDPGGIEHRSDAHSGMGHSGMGHGGAAEDTVNHSIGHGGMEHSGTDDGGAPHSSTDHGTPDHGPVDDRPVDDHPVDDATMSHGGMDHGTMSHNAMDHGTMSDGAMGHSTMSHSAMDHGTMSHSAMDHGTMSHGGMDHGGMNHGDHVSQFRRLFWLMLVLAIPVVGFSGMFAGLLGYGLPDAAWAAWVSPILGTVMYLWGGRPFLSGAISELRQRSPGMMLLIALAITVAFLSSWGASLRILSMELDFWWELALLIVIMLLGHWIEMRSLAQSSSALDSLAALLPDEAERVDADQVTMVAPAELLVGDLVIVRPGGRIPADGLVTEGTADVDESMITGESRPVSRGPGAQVVAGTVATDTALRVRVRAIGDDTALAGIRRLVAEAQGSSSRAQRLADRAAGWLFWFALGVGVLTAIVWSLFGSPEDAVVRTITVLVIACPHALGLAIPLVVAISTERAARGGVLVTDRLALESMRTISTVVFDKTGTLTRGEPVVSHVQPAPGFDEADVLALAAAVEADSEHPLAGAIVAAARRRGLDVPVATGFRAATAVGVTAAVDGQEVAVGGPTLLRRHDAEALEATAAWAEAGAIVLHVLRGGSVIGAIGLADEVRPESREAVAALRAQGIDVVMITGDADAVAQSVAAELGIDRVFAGVHPDDKAAAVVQLQREGRRVAMVGDGVNDAPALAQADVGLAIGAGTDVAIASAGVILASDDPRSVLSVIELSRASYRKMTQNLWWAAGYNLLSVPLAAGVLAPIGFVLPMEVGALLMSASTVVVAVNAQLLRRLDLRPGSSAARALAGATGTRAARIR